jgi:hypothetical protein
LSEARNEGAQPIAVAEKRDNLALKKLNKRCTGRKPPRSLRKAKAEMQSNKLSAQGMIYVLKLLIWQLKVHSKFCVKKLILVHTLND